MPFTLTLADKFGDYGLISVIILRGGGETVEIDEYLMSCRVLQRGVESFAMNHIFAYAAKRGAKRVVGRYARTEKNAMVKEFYKGFGFDFIGGDEKASEWALGVDRFHARETFLNPTTLEI
jgi:FkbH-like protein